MSPNAGRAVSPDISQQSDKVSFVGRSDDVADRDLF